VVPPSLNIHSYRSCHGLNKANRASAFNLLFAEYGDVTPIPVNLLFAEYGDVTPIPVGSLSRWGLSFDFRLLPRLEHFQPTSDNKQVSADHGAINGYGDWSCQCPDRNISDLAQ